VAQLNPNQYKKLTKGMTYGQSDGLYYDATNAQVVIVIADTIVGKIPLTQTAGTVPISSGVFTALTALAGDVTIDQYGTTAIGTAKITPAMLAKPRLRVVTETLTAASLTDGGAAVGTKSLAAAVPAGARYLFTTSTAITAFAGDVSAVITLGDGSDVDRYNTGTPSLFTTAAAGVDMGVASGTAFHAAAVTSIVATVTSNADITPVLAGGGSVNLQFWFLEPI
jgi:hypothetical protein